MKNINIYLILTMIICFGLFQSCSEDIVEVPNNSSQIRNDYEDDEEDNFVSDDVNNEGEIVLGEKRLNPFAIENINEAKNFIYGESMEDKTLTHRYVKFIPTNLEHLAMLEAWESEVEIPVFDYDLLYKIESYGEVYVDPEIEEPLYTYRFASIPEGIDLPEIPYEEIDDLYLDRSDPLLLAQSFFNTGNADDINEYLFEGGLSESQVNEYEDQALVILNIPPKPTTPCYESGYTWQLVHDDLVVNGQINYVWECRPAIPSPPVPTNNCGCAVPNDTRIPSGCLRVQNVAGLIPVQIATVRVKDWWFGGSYTTSSVEGCWSMNERFSGRIWIRVFFRNVNVKAKDTGYSLGVEAVEDFVGYWKRPPYNNVAVDYFSSATDNTSKGRKYWAAAHTLNTVNNYRTSASLDGIPLPRLGLNWINAAGTGAGAAPMLQGNPINSWPALVATMLPGLNALLHLTTGLTPDIVNRYRLGESTAIFNGVGFHELGHASHYSLVGENYWIGYRNHIINNDGYGTLGDFAPFGSSPGRVALGEAVADYVGAKYGGTFAGSEASLFHDGFIPEGLLWDLEDAAPDFLTDPITGATVLDNISGFTPSMIFDGLTPTPSNSVQSIRAFRDNLRTLHLNNTSNSLTNYNTFVDAWDVFN